MQFTKIMKRTFIAAAAATGLFSMPAQAAERFYMMTTDLEVSGTRELETGSPARAIMRSAPIAAAAGTSGKRVAALTNLCIGYTLRGEYAQALSYCDRAVDLDGADVALLVNRGVVRTFTGQRDAGIEDFERALALDPRTYQARANLVTAREKHQFAENLR
jgi:tetratricopeptide (TPR) repeat protein